MVGLPLWTYFSKKYGKIKSWRFAILLSAFALIPFLFFQSGDVAIMAIFSFLGGLVGACDTIMCISILADMVAKEEKKGAKVFAGSLAALRYTVSKIAYAVPLLLAFPILEALDLSKTTDASIIQSSVLISLYAGVPILCRIGAYFYIRSWRK